VVQEVNEEGIIYPSIVARVGSRKAKLINGRGDAGDIEAKRDAV
jgi:hypothetical protein